MKVAIYLRKSRSDIDDLTIEETLQKHKNTLLEFVSFHPEIEVTKIYEEVVSGESLYSRPQMIQLLQDADNGLFDGVLCIDIQRLGRGSSAEQGMIFETFKYNNIKIITPRKTYDLNNESDEDQVEFEGFYARFELRKIKRRLHDGTMRSVKEGCYMPNAPYGYEKTKIGKKPTLKIVDEEARFVRMMFDMYANQGIGTQTIAATINSLGAKPRRGNAFNRTTVAAILRNAVYIGKVVWNKKSTIKKGVRGNDKSVTVYHPKDEWQIYDGLHPAIVDEDLFNRANAILKSHYHRPYNTGEIVNPLAGIFKCEKCGNTMQRHAPDVKRKYQKDFFYCQTKGCVASTNMDRVEHAVLNMLREKMHELEVGKKKKTKTDYDSIITAGEKELKKLKQQKAKLHDLLESGVYDTDTFLERSNVLAGRIIKAENNIKETREKRANENISNPDLLKKKIENILNLYDTSTPAQKNSILKDVIDYGVYYKEKGWKPNQFIINLKYKSF